MESQPVEPGVIGGDAATVGTGAGSLRVLTVQPDGKGPMAWSDFANGAHPVPGERLG